MRPESSIQKFFYPKLCHLSQNINIMNQLQAKTMTSLEIAELTMKNHKEILRDVRAMVKALDGANLRCHCESDAYLNKQGKQQPMFRLDKETSMTLLAGYDVVARHKIVQRWQQLEAERVQVSAIPTEHLLVFTERPKQLANSKEVNSYNYQQGGQQQTIDYNRKNCFYHTGKLPHEIVAWAKARKWPVKNRTSAKEVIRTFKPAMACSMALADDFCKTGKIAIEESATFCKAHALPLFEKMAEFGLLTTQQTPKALLK